MFAEDSGAFLADFGVIAERNGERAQVILDQPDENVMHDHVQSTAYTILFKASSFVGIGHGDSVNVDGVCYSVITVSNVDDGAFKRAELSRVSPP